MYDLTQQKQLNKQSWKASVISIGNSENRSELPIFLLKVNLICAGSIHFKVLNKEEIR